MFVVPNVREGLMVKVLNVERGMAVFQPGGLRRHSSLVGRSSDGHIATGIESHLMPPPDGGDDAVGVGGSDRGLGIIVGLVEEAVDGGPAESHGFDLSDLRPLG
jgi:hypothetical protein